MNIRPKNTRDCDRRVPLSLLSNKVNKVDYISYKNLKIGELCPQLAEI